MVQSSKIAQFSIEWPKRGVVEDSCVSEFDPNPAGLLCQSARLSPFKRTQVDVLHPKSHRSPG